MCAGLPEPCFPRAELSFSPGAPQAHRCRRQDLTVPLGRLARSVDKLSDPFRAPVVVLSVGPAPHPAIWVMSGRARPVTVARCTSSSCLDSSRGASGPPRTPRQHGRLLRRRSGGGPSVWVRERGGEFTHLRALRGPQAALPLVACWDPCRAPVKLTFARSVRDPHWAVNR